MKCPWCRKQIDLPARAWRNADTYGNSVKTITDCCKKIVRLVPTRSYDVLQCADDEDDWGQKAGASNG